MNRARIAGGLVLGGAALVAALTQLERQELVVYADKLAYGVPTVCAGYTDWKLKVGQAYTKADCDAIDAKTAESYGRAIVACIPADKLNQNSLDAFTLFAINVGKSGACGSRAAQLMRAGKHDEGCKAIARGPNGQRVWITSGGKPRRGLANRRDFESALCLRPVERARAAA